MKQIVSTGKITREQILSSSHLPISLACITLKTEVETLKMICREYGIKRWPYNARKEMKRKKNYIERQENNGFFEFHTYTTSFKINPPVTIKMADSKKKDFSQNQLPPFSEFVQALNTKKEEKSF